MIIEGKIQLSVSQLIVAVVENNLNLAVDRYNNYFAAADLLRAKGGQAARGVGAAGATVPDSLFSAAIGAGVGNLTGLGGIGVTGSISGAQRSLNLTPRGAFDPALIFNFSWDRTTSPLNTLVVAGSPVVIPATAFYQVGWQQAFTSGTSFSVQFSNQRQSSTQKFLLFDPDVISRVSVNVVQQVTNGFGFDVNRRFQTVARNNREIVREWFRQQVNTILAQAQNSYWDLVAAQEQLRSAEEALKVAQQLSEDNKRKVEIGAMSPLDVTTADSEVAARDRDRIVAQTNLQTQELNLKSIFSKEITDALGAAEIVATDPFPEPLDADIPSLKEALRQAMRNRPELPQAEGNMKDDEVAVAFTRNLLKPTFNIFGQFATAGLFGNQIVPVSGGPPTVIYGGLGRELTQLVHFKYPEYAAGFALTIPIKNRSAQADSVRAQLNERQATVTLQRTEDQIGREIRNAITGLLQGRAQVEAPEKTLQYNQEVVSAQQQKLQLGAATPYDVVLAQRDLFSAELASVQSKTTYAKALVGLDRSEGVTLDKTRLDLDQVIEGRAAAAVRP
jgi:outer membrane protein TolC